MIRIRARAVVASVAALALVALPTTAAFAAPSDRVAVAAEASPALALIPKPVSLTEGDGSYRIDADAVISAAADALPAAELLADVLRASSGFTLPIEDADAAAAVEITVAPGLAPRGHEAEGYGLTVDAEGIRIEADTAQGAINGVQTLRQLLPVWADSTERLDVDWSVPFVDIEDYPRFDYRGFMVDTARSFYTVDEVKALIDASAPYKLNRLHLHLTDDQGWRLAMDTPDQNASGIDYGLLTEVSGKTAMTYNSAGQLMGTELGRSGFYTKDDYREIVAYAARNGMTVVPEIDMPGHTNAALHAIEQLNSAGSFPKPAPGQATPPAQGTGDVGDSTFDAANPVTYEFISEVLRQVAELTPGQYLHIGGDEAHSTSQADYTTMVDFANAQVADLGKTVVGWNEYATTALPQDDAVIQYWNGRDAGVADAVADHGAQVIMSPAAKAYFPQKQDARQTAGGTWACNGPCTLENAYDWNPAAQVAGVGEDAVLGVEGAFWGEFIRGVDQAQFFSFPRLLALAEVGWTPQAQKNTADFLQRLAATGPRMSVQGVNFFPTATVDWGVDAAVAVTVSDAAAPAAVGVGALAAPAPANARLDWQVAAPATVDGDLAATVTWSDGVVEPVALAATGTTDIAAMTLNPLYTAASSRTFTESGTYTARLDVTSTAGEGLASATATIAVAAPGDPAPGDPAPGGPGAGGPTVGAPGPAEPAPAEPGAGAGAGADAGSGADGAADADARALANTGGELPVGMIVVAGFALALGGLLVWRRRRSLAASRSAS